MGVDVLLSSEGGVVNECVVTLLAAFEIDVGIVVEEDGGTEEVNDEGYMDDVARPKEEVKVDGFAVVDGLSASVLMPDCPLLDSWEDGKAIVSVSVPGWDDWDVVAERTSFDMTMSCNVPEKVKSVQNQAGI